MEYKGMIIEEFLGDITVQFCSDDYVFQSIEDAMKFIDEVSEEMR